MHAFWTFFTEALLFPRVNDLTSAIAVGAPTLLVTLVSCFVASNLFLLILPRRDNGDPETRVVICKLCGLLSGMVLLSVLSFQLHMEGNLSGFWDLAGYMMVFSLLVLVFLIQFFHFKTNIKRLRSLLKSS